MAQSIHDTFKNMDAFEIVHRGNKITVSLPKAYQGIKMDDLSTLEAWYSKLTDDEKLAHHQDAFAQRKINFRAVGRPVVKTFSDVTKYREAKEALPANEVWHTDDKALQLTRSILDDPEVQNRITNFKLKSTPVPGSRDKKEVTEEAAITKLLKSGKSPEEIMALIMKAQNA